MHLLGYNWGEFERDHARLARDCTLFERDWARFLGGRRFFGRCTIETKRVVIERKR
jgi:hypothetical protein